MTLQDAINYIIETISEIIELTGVEDEDVKKYQILLEWLKELQTFRKSFRWIPVSEKLPKNYQEVLVQWEKSSRIYYDIMCLDSDGEWNDEYGVPNRKVIAWMPLPEPYRKP